MGDERAQMLLGWLGGEHVQSSPAHMTWGGKREGRGFSGCNVDDDNDSDDDDDDDDDDDKDDDDDNDSDDDDDYHVNDNDEAGR